MVQVEPPRIRLRKKGGACARLAVGKPSAVRARIAPGAGRTRRMGGRDGRAGDTPLGRTSTAAGAWTRAVTSARLDRLHQVDDAIPTRRSGPGPYHEAPGCCAPPPDPAPPARRATGPQG